MKRIEEAVAYAAKMHAGQTRKMSGMPYILHPMETAVIVTTMTMDEDVIIASILHDVIEDTPATEEEVREMFGERVLELIKSETENKRRDLPASATWRIRKEESLAELEKSSKDTKILWLADKLSNIRSMAEQYSKIGDKIFEAFHEKRKSEHAWYYTRVLEILRNDLSDTFAFKEYERHVNFVFKGEQK